MSRIAILALLALAACGADGPPTPPAATQGIAVAEDLSPDLDPAGG